MAFLFSILLILLIAATFIVGWLTVGIEAVFGWIGRLFRPVFARRWVRVLVSAAVTVVVVYSFLWFWGQMLA